MNGLAERQLLELAVMILSAAVYVALHYACSGIAIAISGKKQGLIRGFLQGIMLCGVFALTASLMLNGAIKWYHIFSYVAFVLLFIKIIHIMQKLFRNKIKRAKK